jgi:hypothetical protein
VLIHYDVSTHLSLFHFFDFLVEFKSLFLVNKSLLKRLPGCLTSKITKIIGHIGAEMVVSMVVVVVMSMVMMAMMFMIRVG